MSHELRTPLNSILGFTQILQYADFSHIDAGRLGLSVEPVFTGEAVEATIEPIQPLAKEMNIAVTVEPSAHWKECTLADRPRLQQVLLNLLSNAVKFNRERGKVRVHCQHPGSDRLRLAVRDTGMGIAADKVHLLFRPFERLDADEAGIEGAGIGLALSKRLVEVMGRKLGVDTERGKGSMFWTEFPTCECVSGGNGPLLQTHESSAASRGAPVKTILYVEDNPSNTVLMHRIVANRPNLRLFTGAPRSSGS
jgi:signal transduction histidine kinase